MKLRRVIAIAIAVMTMVTMSFTTTVFGVEPQADPQDNAVVATDEEAEATEAVEQESTPAPSSEAVEAGEGVELPAYGEASGGAKVVLKTEGIHGFPGFDAAKKATKGDASGEFWLWCYGAHYVQGGVVGVDSQNYDYVKILRSLKKTKNYKVIKTVKNTSSDWLPDVQYQNGAYQDVILFTDKKVKAGKKYYYKVRAYKNGVSGYDTVDYTHMFDPYTEVYKYPLKVTKNTYTFGKSSNYGTYSEDDPLPIRSMKLYYSKGRLVAKVKFHNECGHKTKKLTKFHLIVYDDEGDVIGEGTFSKSKFVIKKNKFKTVTFKFSKSKTKIRNLRYYVGGYEGDYKFTYYK